MKLDPRGYVVEKRLSGVRRILAVTGWKGGIGKSSTACALALALADAGCKTGLLDLDFTGSSDHVILGVKNEFPAEIDGLKPPVVSGVAFMGIAYFSGGHAAPLRGGEISSALLELLAVTNWGELDYLVLDMPPGISDAALDALKFFKRAELIAVTTPSVLSQITLERSLEMFKGLAKFAGIVENLSGLGPKASYAGLPVLAKIPYDPQWENAVGSPAAIRKTSFFLELKKNLTPALLRGQ
ncbi:MAG: P-loop NTPase [Elusimicrobiaceae bacterium]